MPSSTSKPAPGMRKTVMESRPSGLAALNDYFKGVKDTARIVLVPFSRIRGDIPKAEDANGIGYAVSRMIADHPGLSIQVIANDLDMKNKVVVALVEHAVSHSVV